MIEKILERLEEEALQAEKDMGLSDTFAEAERSGGRWAAYEKAYKIVQEVAKDGDWILCSSGQVPENCRVCWITWKIDRYAEEVYRASCHNGCWFNLDTQEEVDASEIIAWKYYEKPAPYQKKECKDCEYFSQSRFYTGKWYCQNPNVTVASLPVDKEKCFEPKKQKGELYE